MTTRSLFCKLALAVCFITFATNLKADEASGIVTNTSFGAFQLDENGTVRQFNLSRSKSTYEPVTWFPQAGDKVKVTFVINSGKKTVLEVQKVELVQIGPNNAPPPVSPITVEIVEAGKSGWKGKVPTGQVVKFESSRKTVVEPAGLVLMTGQKAKITFHPEKVMFLFGISYVADKVEKVDK